jgi:colicin import membrane protein
VIVFTATNRRTQQVFVGKAQESVDEEWAHMLAQAEVGAEGVFFDLVREDASEFKVETWAYAETPAETRESFREAREDLDAVVIKLPRSRPSNSNAQPVRSASMKALLDSIKEAAEDFDGADEDTLTESGSDGLVAEDARSSDGAESEEAANPSAAAKLQDVDARDADRLQARIDAMKTAQKKVLGKKPAAVRNTVIARKPDAPMKLATGRTGSALKEQRIKDAIETDKEQRDVIRAKSNFDQQAEMNALMARVEMRRTAHKLKKQEEAKKRAAAATREKKAAEKAELQVKKEAKALRAQAEKQSKVLGVHAPQALSQEQAEDLVVKSRSLDTVAAQASSDERVLDAVTSIEAEKSKEERVREGMAQQRAARVVQRRSLASQEADEMSSLLARLDPGSRTGSRRRTRGSSES